MRVFFNILRRIEWLNLTERRKLMTDQCVGLAPAIACWAVDADESCWVLWGGVNAKVGIWNAEGALAHNMFNTTTSSAAA